MKLRLLMLEIRTYILQKLYYPLENLWNNQILELQDYQEWQDYDATRVILDPGWYHSRHRFLIGRGYGHAGDRTNPRQGAALWCRHCVELSGPGAETVQAL